MHRGPGRKYKVSRRKCNTVWWQTCQCCIIGCWRCTPPPTIEHSCTDPTKTPPPSPACSPACWGPATSFS
ncbi:hypothetical protein IP65_00755 [Novosphingobium sp. AAP1]|nr:hypothetical protein IP65_00755 [Novosphingobium sp. AAP1]